MKTLTHMFGRALVLAAIVAGTAVSLAQAGIGRPPDVRDAAGAVQAAVPDAIERWAAAHPYGDTPDPSTVIAAHFRHEDALSRLQSAGLQHPSTTTPGGSFDWSDYGIGIVTGIGLVLLFAGGVAGMRLRRHPAQPA